MQGDLFPLKGLDKILQQFGKGRLSQGKDGQTEKAQGKIAGVGFHVGEQSKVDLQTAGSAFLF